MLRGTCGSFRSALHPISSQLGSASVTRPFYCSISVSLRSRKCLGKLPPSHTHKQSSSGLPSNRRRAWPILFRRVPSRLGTGLPFVRQQSVDHPLRHPHSPAPADPGHSTQTRIAKTRCTSTPSHWPSALRLLPHRSTRASPCAPTPSPPESVRRYSKPATTPPVRLNAIHDLDVESSPVSISYQRAAVSVRARPSLNMSNDPTARRLLPQTSQMGSFSFAPQAYQQQPRETQKSAPGVEFSMFCVDSNRVSLDYVFVDEHNRHKRLKGMSLLPFPTLCQVQH